MLGGLGLRVYFGFRMQHIPKPCKGSKAWNFAIVPRFGLSCAWLFFGILKAHLNSRGLGFSDGSAVLLKFCFTSGQGLRHPSAVQNFPQVGFQSLSWLPHLEPGTPQCPTWFSCERHVALQSGKKRFRPLHAMLLLFAGDAEWRRLPIQDMIMTSAPSTPHFCRTC